MKVYVVTADTHYLPGTIGVYSTKEKAIEGAKKYAESTGLYAYAVRDEEYDTIEQAEWYFETDLLNTNNYQDTIIITTYKTDEENLVIPFNFTMKDKIFLLSVKEAKKLPKEILRCECLWWWLRTPIQTCIMAVFSNGIIHFNGTYCDYCNGGIRPAIKFNTHEEILNLPTLNNGQDVIYLAEKWIDITKYIGFPCLLKKTPFEETIRFDGFGRNLYEYSEIRRWLLNWYEEKCKQ